MRPNIVAPGSIRLGEIRLAAPSVNESQIVFKSCPILLKWEVARLLNSASVLYPNIHFLTLQCDSAEQHPTRVGGAAGRIPPEVEGGEQR